MAYGALGELGIALLVAGATEAVASLLEGVVFSLHPFRLAVVAGFALADLLAFHIGDLAAVFTLAVVALGAF